MDKIRLTQAVIVEGRDDVRAVSEACDALIIPTHGFGITGETWEIAAKAYRERGLIILTDPDHAGTEIRRRFTDRFPDAIHAYIDRGDARSGDDIGVENASPEVITEAIKKALVLAKRRENQDRREGSLMEDSDRIAPVHDGRYADMKDLMEMGLAAADGASERRAAVCKELGIGYANASAMTGRLRGFGIDIYELKKAVKKCEAQKL